ELVGLPVTLDRPAKAEHGDYATNVALQAAAQAGKAPRELAQGLAAKGKELHAAARAEVAGPGFLNLFLSKDWYADALGEIVAAERDYGAGSATSVERVQVEMVFANPTGP